MKNLDVARSSGGLTPWWALIAVVCGSPLFFFFALRGDPGKGRAAMLSAAVIVLAIRTRWDLSHYFWFWLTMAMVMGYHVFFVLFTHWPQEQYPGFTLLLPAMVDYAIIYAVVRIAERILPVSITGNGKSKHSS